MQRTDSEFTAKSACVSCHNNSLGAMAVSAARESRVCVDENIAASQVKANADILEKSRERMYQGFFVSRGRMFGPFIMGYILTGLGGEQYPADLNTDAVAFTSGRTRRRTGVGLSRRRHPAAAVLRPYWPDYALDAGAAALCAED